MNRRDFLKNLVVGVAGLYVPKTLYFDMKPRLVELDRAWLIDMVRRAQFSMLKFDLIGVQPLVEPKEGLIHTLKEKYGTPDRALGDYYKRHELGIDCMGQWTDNDGNII